MLPSKLTRGTLCLYLAFCGKRKSNVTLLVLRVQPLIIIIQLVIHRYCVYPWQYEMRIYLYTFRNCDLSCTCNENIIVNQSVSRLLFIFLSFHLSIHRYYLFFCLSLFRVWNNGSYTVRYPSFSSYLFYLRVQIYTFHLYNLIQISHIVINHYVFVVVRPKFI